MGQLNMQPFSVFGQALKGLRVAQKKTPAEVSGAVEISEQKLLEYELGKERPSEDILLLLIQHFQLQDTQAKELWRLAGYDQPLDDTRYFITDDSGEVKQSKTVFVSPEDARIVYTDMVQVMVNNYGVIMNFMQGAGPQNQPLAVSRVGMSKEHAKSILELLRATLEQSEQEDAHIQKQLPLSAKNKEE
jgi:transcriptional regulator with XRE-family HTH domain